MDCNFSFESKDDTAIVNIEGEMNIYSSEELKEKFLDLLDSHKNLTIELNNISSIDTSGIQILIFLKKESERLNKNLNLKSHNQVILRFLNLYGLVGFFADKISISKRDKETFHFNYGTKIHPDRIPVQNK